MLYSPEGTDMIYLIGGLVSMAVFAGGSVLLFIWGFGALVANVAKHELEDEDD